ncbi:hypothetical protein, partial [Okeania sp. SIO3B5]|uniref:hypothetical protein n=1 Tax=Okeania sp. SIO3B5 TaxID=2607811 RepID=UPI0025F5A161
LLGSSGSKIKSCWGNYGRKITLTIMNGHLLCSSHFSVPPNYSLLPTPYSLPHQKDFFSKP